LQHEDRVLFVGDTRQHEAVDAGRPYQQLQEAGMHAARLDEILRQQDAALKVTVEQLARRDVVDAIQNLDRHRSLATTARYLRIATIKVCSTASPLDWLPCPVTPEPPPPRPEHF
jgi:ATP-dependent exoDNAse (exonuclease V) alpha subunit